jgi:hypothetical protein
MTHELKDSGRREDFTTGSRRDTRQGKGRFDLIPTYPEFRLALLMERGADKYGERNWEKGQPLMRYLDSARRHLNNLLAGEQTEDHAIQAVFNLFGFVHTLNEIENGRLPQALDDRPDRMRPKQSEPIPFDPRWLLALDGTEGGDVLANDDCCSDGPCSAEHDPVLGLL